MKNLSLFSLLFMVGMVLFLGGCQREEVNLGQISEEENKVVSSRLVNQNSLPSQLILDMNEKWYQTSSKSRTDIYNLYGDIYYENALTFTNSNDINLQGYSVPFEKDGKVTAIMIYINDEQSDFNLFDFVTFDELLNISLNNLDDFYKNGYLKLVLNQFILHQHYKNGCVSTVLLNNLSQVDGLRSNKNGNRCSTVYSVEITSYIITETYNYTSPGGYEWNITADVTLPLVEFTITVIGCHPSANLGQTGVGINFPIISNNNNGAGSISNTELKECIEKKISPIMAGFIDEQLDGYIFPCSQVSLEEKKKNLKNEIIKNWCIKSNDNNKITGEDIFNGASVALADEKYLTQYDLNYLNTLIDPCTGEPVDKENIYEEFCQNSSTGAAALNAALEGVDYIDDNAISDNKCPCVNSIWKLIKSQTANSEFGSSECSVLELLSDYLEGPLQAEIGISTLNLPESTNAVAIPNTTNVGNGSELLLFNTRIEINPHLCGGTIDKDPLEIAGTLLHELIHARIFESLYNRGYFGQLAGGTENFNVRWNNFIQSNYPNIVPVGYDQHKLMAQSYVNDLAQALHDLNGGVGEPSDYLLIAWQGLLGAYPEETRHLYDFLPNIQELQDNFNNNVKGQGTLQFNGCN